MRRCAINNDTETAGVNSNYSGKPRQSKANLGIGSLNINFLKVIKFLDKKPI